MHAWEQIQVTIDFIEEHLSEEIKIENLAEMAALSPFYYQRLFRRLVKKPVSEYIKLRRMAKATELLLQKDRRILDIALDLGFSSHQQFSRTFKSTFDRTPEEYRKVPTMLNRMTKPQLSLNYTLIDEGVPLIANGIILEINRKVLKEPIHLVGFEVEAPIGFISTLGIESGTDPLLQIWEDFHRLKTSTFSLDAESEEFSFVSAGNTEGHFNYFAGGRAISTTLPENCCKRTLPAGEYIACSFEAESFEALVMDVLYKAEQYLFSLWLPNHNLCIEPFSVECYESHTINATKMEVWVKTMTGKQENHC